MKLADDESTATHLDLAANEMVDREMLEAAGSGGSTEKPSAV